MLMTRQQEQALRRRGGAAVAERRWQSGGRREQLWSIRVPARTVRCQTERAVFVDNGGLSNVEMVGPWTEMAQSGRGMHGQVH